MVLRRYTAAVIAGIVLSGVAAGLLGALGPSAGFPRLSRNLLADYRVLGTAPFGSGLQLFMLSVFIDTSCLLVTGLLARRRTRAEVPPAMPEYEDGSLP